MKTAICALLLCIQAGAATFHERAEGMMSAFNDNSYGSIAVHLKRHEQAEWCSKRLIELLNAGPTGDVFWMFPVTAVAFLDQGQLSEQARQALKKSWKTYMPYRGDTENHFLLYYTCLYLMSQLWPDGDWYTGNSSQENIEEARQWIEGWVKLTTTRGQGEYDSPHYMGVYLLPMSYLAAWAKDPRMRKTAEMMLEYLIADFAPENLDGLYVGAHARVYEDQLVEKWNGVSSDFAWLWFELGRPLKWPGSYILYYLVAGAFEPPEILKKIATDRSKPYTHYERKRTRNRWRFHDDLHGPVYKTTFVRAEYAVSSDQGGALQPIQEHSWDVTWHVPDPRGVQNTFFFNHPYSSMKELQTFFVFPPDGAVEGIVKSKKTYDSSDRLLGGSAYEKIVQDQDALVALYNIPEGTRFPHINGFFSKDLSEVTEDKSGWIFMRGGDSTYIACRPLQPYVWKGNRLFSPWLRNGVVVQAAAASEFANLREFGKAIAGLPLDFTLDPTPRVKFTTLRGKVIDFTYGDAPKMDWALFGGPFLQSEVNSQVLTMTYGRMRRTLDFKTLTVSETQ